MVVAARDRLWDETTLAGGRFPLRFEGDRSYAPLETRGEQRMSQAAPEILRGTLDLLILKALSWGPAHGYAVARWIEQATNDALAVGEGTLYPALHRLEERGWIAASWGASENNRQAKFYALTRKGRAQLRVETDELAPLCGGGVRGARRAGARR